MLSGCSSCGGNKFQFQPTVEAEQPGEDAVETPDTSDDRRSGTGADRASGTDRSSPDVTGQSGGASGTMAGTPRSSSPPDSPSRSESEDSGVTGTVANAADTVRDWMGSDSGSTGTRDRSESSTTEPEPGGGGTLGETSEDTAQADARSDIVAPDELPDSPSESEEAITPADVDFDDSRPSAADGGTPSATKADPSDRYGEASEDPPDLEALRDELNQQFESIRIVAPGRYELNLMELYDRDEYIISLLEDGRYAIEVPEAWRND
jgi:predicted  nucleic acid-binding Zn-ribbon protein